jgi:glutamate 5-kinase
MTLVVKLGSSVVVDDDGSLREDVLDTICAEVGTLEGGEERVVLVTSGAIARGMRLLGLAERPREMDALQACSAIGQGDLYRAYESRLAEGGTRAAQVLLTLTDVAERSHYLNVRNTLERLLAWQVVPVINENDTTATDEVTFGDNDFLAALVAPLLKARLLVLLTNTDGVFTADPRLEPQAELIARVEDRSALAAVEIGDTSTLGRGGMLSKITSAQIASESGVEAVICNGTRAGELVGAAGGGEVGTRFSPQVDGILPPYKLWLKYAKPARGVVFVDKGAAKQLRLRGSSLLAVGIADFTGTFNVGDAVDVREFEGSDPIGRGITNFSSRELAQVAGKQSGQIRQLLAHAADEVIHRDRFVLF